MASLVYAMWSITNVASMHCAVRPEISPCTCEPIFMTNTVDLFCERVDSFHRIVDALSDKFTPNISISLKISHSQLEDLEMRSFGEMNLNLKKLGMVANNMKSLPELPFRGLSEIEYLSLSDNVLEEIPKHVLNHLPKISTLDLGRGRIRSVSHDDFKGIPNLSNLMLAANLITRMDKNAYPRNLRTLHIGRNKIDSLNGTLRDLNELKFLFINMNNLTTLENELPTASENLQCIMAQNNRIEKLPQSMKDLPILDTLFIGNNRLKSFDGVFKHGRHILRLFATNNTIEYLAEDEFQEADIIEELDLSHNCLKSLNKSLLPLVKLQIANFSFNYLEEFSINEIRGLRYLKSFDISHNKIKRLTGRMENLVEPNTFLIHLRLNNNELKSLDGALMGLNKLKSLTLTYNQIERILPDDFIGLESLEDLELSHNQLLTLEETSTTYLPSLKRLYVQYNNLTKLERDFHGLPSLCLANMSNNQIISISSELVSKTRCSNHGVPVKLEIWLENNPIMCSESIRDLCPIMDSQEARLRGRSQCLPISSDEEICSDRPLIAQPPLSLIPQIIQTQLQQGASPTIVQVIVPAPVGGGKTVVIQAEIPLPILSSTTTSTTSTTTTTDPPVPTTEAAMIETTEIPTTITTTTVATLRFESPPITPYTPTEYGESIQYSPIVETRHSSSLSSDTDDNSVHVQYSPIVLAAPDNSQLLLLPEEPPETP